MNTSWPIVALVAVAGLGGSAGLATDVETVDSILTEARLSMVKDQIADRGINDQRVLAAMRLVERHKFVPLRPSHTCIHGQTASN